MDRFVRKGGMFLLACLCSTLLGFGTRAQEMPTDYQEVLKSLDRKGDFKAGVLKVNIPRNDLKMTIQGVSTPTPFGFGGWVAMTKGTDITEVMMGDLVLLDLRLLILAAEHSAIVSARSLSAQTYSDLE